MAGPRRSRPRSGKRRNKAAMPRPPHVRAKALEAAAVARGDLATAFSEGPLPYGAALKIHSATIDPTPGFRGHTLHANPLRGIRLNLSLARVRDRESAIVVYLQGLKRSSGTIRAPGALIMGLPISRRHSTWLSGSCTSGEAAHAYISIGWPDGRGPRRDRSVVAARREGRAPMRERTLAVAEVKASPGARLTTMVFIANLFPLSKIVKLG